MSVDTAEGTPIAPEETGRGMSRSDPNWEFVPMSQAFGWDKGGLVVRSDTVLNRYNVAYLSPSTAKAMDGCPARWAAEKAMPERDDPFGAADLGTSGHAVLEDLYQLPGSERTQATAMNILRRHSLIQWPGHDDETLAQRTRWVAEVYQAMIGLWTIEDPTTVVVQQTEMKADGVEIGGVPFKGFIDRVDLTPDGVKVVDYKTGKKMPQNITRFGDDHGDQIRLYAHVIEAMTGVMPTEGYLYYTRSTVAKGRKVPMNPKVMREVLAKFQKSYKALTTYHARGEFPTKTSPLCGWCVLVTSCPSAQVDGKEPRIEGLPTKTDLGIPVLRTFEAAEITPAARKETNRRSPGWDVDFDASTPPRDDIVPTDSVPVDPHVDLFHVPDVVVAAEPGRASERHDAESVPEHAAHLTDNQPTTRENTMSDQTEEKPWIEAVDGVLNPNSYAAVGVFALAQMAYEEINVAGIKPNKALIDALAQTFAHMVEQAQVALTDKTGFGLGAHKRLRGALKTYQEANPLPFGQDRAAWDAWVDLGIKHMKAMAAAALRLYDDPIPATPWASLATQADDFAGTPAASPAA